MYLMQKVLSPLWLYHAMPWHGINTDTKHQSVEGCNTSMNIYFMCTQCKLNADPLLKTLFQWTTSGLKTLITA